MIVERIIKASDLKSQSLFYWIIYSYKLMKDSNLTFWKRLNPYFIGLSILINWKIDSTTSATKVSILILLDYLFL